jgi:hypothetical protein
VTPKQLATITKILTVIEHAHANRLFCTAGMLQMKVLKAFPGSDVAIDSATGKVTLQNSTGVIASSSPLPAESTSMTMDLMRWGFQFVK